MGIVHSSVVDAPRAEVFAWHGRPGAIHRLLPPWQPMSVVAEATSLADGRAVLGLPGGLRWIADHQPDAYDPPARFVDALGRDGLRSLPATLFGPWRHEHSFDAVDAERTRVTDRVDAVVPQRFLRQMFRYRHRQLADDLAGHRWAREHGDRPTTVAVTGAGGLVGTALTAFLSTGGYRVIRLVRRPASGPGSDAGIRIRRMPRCSTASTRSSTWPAPRSRAASPPRTRAPCATVGSSRPGGWPNARRPRPTAPRRSCAPRRSASTATTAGTSSSTNPRPGGRLSRRPGLRLGGRHRARVGGGTAGGARAYRHRAVFTRGHAASAAALVRGRSRGQVGLRPAMVVVDRPRGPGRCLSPRARRPGTGRPGQCRSPDPVRNTQYTRELARVLRRPAVLPVPDVGPSLLLGEQGARELAAASQRVIPRALTKAGHRFRRPTLEQCLRHQLGHLDKEN